MEGGSHVAVELFAYNDQRNLPFREFATRRPGTFSCPNQIRI